MGMGVRESIIEHAEQMTGADQMRSILPQIEFHLGSIEKEDAERADECDEAWKDFIAASMRVGEAHGAVSTMTPKEAEAALRDNYGHAPFSVMKSFPKDTQHPVIAWAAFNKSRYKGWNDEIGVVRALALAGYDPNLPDDNTMTPLHYMAYWNEAPHSSPRGVRLLLKAGAEVDAKNRRGDTPLLYVCASEVWTEATHHSAIALLEAGADPLSEAGDGTTPLSLLKDNERKNPCQARHALISHIEGSAGIVCPFGEDRMDRFIHGFAVALGKQEKQAGEALMEAMENDDEARSAMRASAEDALKIMTAAKSAEDMDGFMAASAAPTGDILSRDIFSKMSSQFYLARAVREFDEDKSEISAEDYEMRITLVIETIKDSVGAG